MPYLYVLVDGLTSYIKWMILISYNLIYSEDLIKIHWFVWYFIILFVLDENYKQ